MAIAQRFHRSACLLSFGLTVTALIGGCCGPMACGPMGCGSCSSGPLLLGSGSCGGGDCDGCGERYIDEWVNHPPSCDQCDSCGNHNGQTCGQCRPIFDGFASLWGYRRDGGCDSGGCSGSSCDGGCAGGCQAGSAAGDAYLGGDSDPQYFESSAAIPMPHQPLPAPRILEAKPPIKPYQPEHSKQIFRPKGAVAGATPRTRGY